MYNFNFQQTFYSLKKKLEMLVTYPETQFCCHLKGFYVQNIIVQMLENLVTSCLTDVCIFKWYIQELIMYHPINLSPKMPCHRDKIVPKDVLLVYLW